MAATFSFTSELWLHHMGSWVFVSVPEDETEVIRELFGTTVGFGSIRVSVQIAATSWMTSIFPSKESGLYVLPIKKDVRKAINRGPGDTADIELTILD